MELYTPAEYTYFPVSYTSSMLTIQFRSKYTAEKVVKMMYNKSIGFINVTTVRNYFLLLYY
jgi:hypothetical protein